MLLSATNAKLVQPILSLILQDSGAVSVVSGDGAGPWAAVGGGSTLVNLTSLNPGIGPAWQRGL